MQRAPRGRGGGVSHPPGAIFNPPHTHPSPPAERPLSRLGYHIQGSRGWPCHPPRGFIVGNMTRERGRDRERKIGQRRPLHNCRRLNRQLSLPDPGRGANQQCDWRRPCWGGVSLGAPLDNVPTQARRHARLYPTTRRGSGGRNGYDHPGTISSHAPPPPRPIAPQAAAASRAGDNDNNNKVVPCCLVLVAL